MATKTNIYNMALTRLGEARLASDSDSTNPALLLTAIWDTILEQALFEGPEEGWRFARRRYHGIDDDSTAITAIADGGSTTLTVDAEAHGLIVGDEVELAGDTGYDGTYDVSAITSATPDTFTIAGTYVATGTGTAHWRSQEYAYRFAIPTCTRVTSVQAGGVELADWVREGSYILTNQESSEVDIMYILGPTAVTETNFPMHFVDVLWRKLAIHLCYSLVQNASIQQQLITELEQIYMPRAIGMDNREQYVKEYSSAWVDAGRRAMVE